MKPPPTSLARTRRHGCPHAVQAAGDLIAPAAELAARVQYCEHDLKRALAGLFLYIDGDTSAVIAHADNVALFYRHGDAGAEARQSLVDGVVDDLIHKVMQTRQRCRAYLHTRALSYGLKSLKDLDLRSIIF